jgi:hypothetical protein
MSGTGASSPIDGAEPTTHSHHSRESRRTLMRGSSNETRPLLAVRPTGQVLGGVGRSPRLHARLLVGRPLHSRGRCDRREARGVVAEPASPCLTSDAAPAPATAGRPAPTTDAATPAATPSTDSRGGGSAFARSACATCAHALSQHLNGGENCAHCGCRRFRPTPQSADSLAAASAQSSDDAVPSNNCDSADGSS